MAKTPKDDDDDQNLDSLSPQEREVLEANDAELAALVAAEAEESSAEDEAVKVAVKKGVEAEEAAEAADGDEDEVEAEAGAEAGAEDATAATEAEVSEAELIAQTLSERAPKIVDFDEEAAKAAREAIKTERKEIVSKFNQGDMNEDEFEAAIEGFNDRLADLKADEKRFAEAKAEYFAWDTRRWGASTLKFFKDNPAFSMGEGATDDQKARGARLSEIIKEMGQSPHSKARDYAKLLTEAQTIYTVRYPEDADAAPKAKAKAAPKAAAKPKKPAPDPRGKKPEIPPRLTAMPAADISDADDESPWAALNHLAETNPQRFEAALNRMTEDERRAYERAS